MGEVLMPSIKLNKKEFDKLLGKKLPDEKLKDRISLLGTDLDGLDDEIIDVEIFPNRPDMLSMQGFVRAFSSFIGINTGLKEYKVSESGESLIVEKSVSEVRPFTACAIIKNLKFNDERIKEVIMMQEKLHVTYGRNRKKAAIGIYPMEKIAFPIKFTARKPEDIIFRPLEGKTEMNALEILEKHPAGKDYGHLLEGKELFPVFIDANDKVLSVPPIINSHETGRVTEETKDVFIECSGFDYRVLQKCLNMIVTAFADMGGEIQTIDLQYPDTAYVSPDLSPEEADIDIEYVKKLLGIDMNEKEMEEYLAKMGFGYKKGKVLVPSYRADILHQVDFVEDIAIAYGYENFEPEIPKVATVGEEDKFEIMKNKVIEILIGLGLQQINTFHLTNEDKQNSMMNTEAKLVRLGNSISQDYDVLKSWLTPDLLECYAGNKHHDYPQNIFSIGKIFKHDSERETGVREDFRIAVGVCGENAGYTEIKQVLDYLLKALDVDYDIKEVDHDSFIPGRAGRMSIEDQKLAYLGEVSPFVLENWGLEMPVACFELNLTELLDIVYEKAMQD